MTGGSAAEPEIVEIGSSADELARGPGRPGRVGGPRGPRSIILPAVAISALGAAVVGLALAGRAPVPPPAPVPGVAAGTMAAGAATPSVPAPNAPVAVPSRATASGAGPAAPVPPTTVPQPRASGAAFDPWVLLEGAWVDLATGNAGSSTGCEIERPLVLAGGRIVCVARGVARSPGSYRATYALSVVTLGRPRAGAPVAAAGLPPPPPLRSPLRALTGRTDLTLGSPVAVSLAPGTRPDTLLMAWAVLGDDGYRVGVDEYRVGDSAAFRLGARLLFVMPLEVADTTTSLDDLAVTIAPGGASALVGVTVSGGPGQGVVRRLTVVGVSNPGSTAAASPGNALGLPVELPASVAANEAGPALATRDAGAPCGGGDGEGWATDTSILLVCPGRPAVLRRVDVLAGLRAGHEGDGRRWSPTILGETLLATADPAGRTFLAGNGVAIDRTAHRYFRWSPEAHTLWAVDLDPRAGVSATAASLELPSTASEGSIPPADSSGARPVMAFDQAREQLYLLAPDPSGSGATVWVLDAGSLAVEAAWPTAPEPFKKLTASTDGSLIYLATAPRPVEGSERRLVAIQVLDARSGAERLYTGSVPCATWDDGRALIAP